MRATSASVIVIGLLGIMVSFGAPQRAEAQAQPSSTAAPGAAAGEWSAWFGCWAPRATLANDGPTMRCVVPGADGRGARMLTLAGDRVVMDDAVAATGQPESLAEAGCTGQRVTRWAHAGPRFFVATALNCEGKPAITTSGISALVTPDAWLDVQVARVEGREDVRTAQFRRTTEPLPDVVARALDGVARTRPQVTAVVQDDVIEASRYVAPSGVEAWLAESRGRLPINKSVLLALSKGGVAPQVIDLLVAQAFPGKFEVRRSPIYGGGSVGAGGPFIDDGFGSGVWGPYSDFYYYGVGVGALGLGAYGNGFQFGYPYGYYPYGLITVPGDGGGVTSPGPQVHGQVVNGVGYTRIQSREPSQAIPSGSQAGRARADSNSGAESSGGFDSGSSSGGGSTPSGVSSDGYSGGGGTSTGLTAVPR